MSNFSPSPFIPIPKNKDERVTVSRHSAPITREKFVIVLARAFHGKRAKVIIQHFSHPESELPDGVACNLRAMGLFLPASQPASHQIPKAQEPRSPNQPMQHVGLLYSLNSQSLPSLLSNSQDLRVPRCSSMHHDRAAITPHLSERHFSPRATSASTRTLAVSTGRFFGTRTPLMGP